MQNYTPRPGREAKEDFFTELFAYTLRNEPVMLQKFQQLIDWECNKPLICTQKTFPINSGKFCRCDLLLLDPITDDGIIIESKIGDEFKKKQIYTYLELAQERNLRVISITRDDSPKITELQNKHAKEGIISKFQHFFWFQIYMMIRKVGSDKGLRSPFLIQELIKYMEEENMAEFEGFRDCDLGTWSAYDQLREKMDSYLEQLKLKLQSDGFKPKQNNSEAELFRGYKLVAYKDKEISGYFWIGFWHIDFDRYRDGRIFCCIQLDPSDKSRTDKLMKQSSLLERSTKEDYDGVMRYKALMSIIGDSDSDEQRAKLDEFFINSIKQIQKDGCFEFIY